VKEKASFVQSTAVQCGGRGETDLARPDDQHPRALQRLLPRPADFGQDQMARIAFDFVFGKDHRPI
jgi:hypothetical protein